MELKLDTSDAHVFVWPGSTPEDVSTSSPGDDALLICFVSLSIPPNVNPPSKILSLNITLQATENIGFGRAGYETNHPFDFSRDCESAVDMPLQSGKVYRWELPIQIPQNTVPYERCSSGRVYYRLSAKAQFGGLLKKKLSAEKDMFVVAVPSKDGVLDYARSHGSFAEHLGPIAIVIRSQHLTVGGYARLAISLPSPSPSLVLKRVSLTLIQSAMLHSRKKPGYIEQGRQERETFHEVDAAELLKLQHADGTFDCNWIARLPHDSRVRPSTLPGSKAALRLSHMFEVKVVFAADSSPDSPELQYKASWSLILPNCCCLWRSMRLPSYSIWDPDPVPERSRDDWQPDKYANIHVSHSGCACGETLEKLLTWEDEADDDQRLCTTRAMREQMHNEWMRRGAGGASAADEAHASHADPVALSARLAAHGQLDEERTTEVGASQPTTPGAGGGTHGASTPLTGFPGLPLLPEETQDQKDSRMRRLKEAQQYVQVHDYEY